ncbi:carboxypeptidase regulatory-like domain-containing protein [[Leptolyngbya] sp. PCC 7376]|uniref:carboxypeptidase regulatory-like domain-containing protein n=1 Tax=[Leptolyngbya] sp. PCC 7376 TaxID=111781 RepID=UPI001CED20B4|nr:carboxypeptidase regulatory-like domain-containing protein [[Leptolyngbya] sp. PCC 7376]
MTQAPIQSENSESETTELINVEIIVLDSGENLPIQDVEVRVVSTGGPEVRRTNTDGFVQIEIPTRDDVGITLAKDGFQTSRHSINLKNDPNRTREYYLVKE